MSFQSGSAITYQTSNSIPDSIQQVERCKREEQERANGSLKNAMPHLHLNLDKQESEQTHKPQA